MKRIIINVLAIMAIIFVPLYAQSENDFEVKQNSDNTLTITGYNGTMKNLVIPNTLYGLKVTVIGESAFINKGLTSVVIPDTVITIENAERIFVSGYNRTKGAFRENEKLTTVIFGNGLKTIGDYAFYGCSQLSEINIPNSVTRIGNYSLCDVGLKKVSFGTGLQTIGSSAFAGNEIVELNLPSSLKEIETEAFRWSKIQKVTFGTGLQTIGAGAFKGNQITELNLPSSLREIGGGAFAGNLLQSVMLPNGITSISNYVGYMNWQGAFENNPLTTVAIPASLANGGIDSYSSPTFGNIKNSTITRITIPARMGEDTLRGNFEEAFVNFWINQNKAGGTYVKRGPIWTKE